MSVNTIRSGRRVPAIKKYLIFAIISAILFGTLFAFQEQIPEVLGIAKKATLTVDTAEVGSKVYLNNNYIGETPLENTIVKAGFSNLSIKGVKNTYTTSLNLIDKSDNIIYRELGVNNDLSSGINIWEGTLDDRKVEVFVKPENAEIKINEKESSPEEIYNLGEGDYNFQVSSPGYKEVSFAVSVRKDFKTNIEIKLTPLPHTKDIQKFGGYDNIYYIQSSNPDVFSNSKDWIGHFLNFYKKRTLSVGTIQIIKDTFFDYYVDYAGRIYDKNGNQIDTLDLVEEPTQKNVALLLRSNDKEKLNERTYKSLLVFNPNVELNAEIDSEPQKISAKLANLDVISQANTLGVQTSTSTAPSQGVTNSQTLTLPNPAVSVQTPPASDLSVNKKVIINNDVLKVRKEPAGEEIGLTSINTEFKYLGETTDGWVKIPYKNSIGYVSKQYVKIVSE
jgi:hypothetical protein